LHGGGGSGPGFKRELGADLQTALGSGYELVFPSAPDNGLWMRDPPNGKGEATTDADWASESLRILDSVVTHQGPFYGILGYSQGSAFVSVYLAHAPSNTFQVAAMFAGYVPTTHQGIVSTIKSRAPFNNIPALVWMGGADPIITNDMTRAQAAIYTNPTVVRSANNGHVVPSSSDPTFAQVVSFINDPSAALPPTSAPSTNNAGDSNDNDGGGKGDNAGKDSGKSGWKQQADGSWVDTSTGETYGSKTDGSKGTDGNKDTDSGKGDDAGKTDSNKDTDSGKGDDADKTDGNKDTDAGKGDTAGKTDSNEDTDSGKSDTAGKTDSNKDTDSGKGDNAGKTDSNKDTDSGKGDNAGKTDSNKDTDSGKSDNAGKTDGNKDTDSGKGDNAGKTDGNKDTDSGKGDDAGKTDSNKDTDSGKGDNAGKTDGNKDTDSGKGDTAGKTDGKGDYGEKKPTTKPAVTKAPATKACANDSSWRQARGNKGKVYSRRSCDWVAKRSSKRCRRKGLEGISAFAACPKVCGTCPL